MTSSFDHVHLYAADLAAAIAFYVDVLGGERIGRLPSGGRGDNHLLLLGGQFLVVSAFPEGIAPAPPADVGDGALTHGFGVAHLGLNVSDLDATLARLRSAGVHIHSEPRANSALRFVYFSAPDGVVIELTQYTLPRHLKPLAGVANAINWGIHRVRRGLGRQLVGKGGRG